MLPARIRRWLSGVIALSVVTLAPTVLLAQYPQVSVPTITETSIAPGDETQQRIQNLEAQNQELNRQLRDLSRRLDGLSGSSGAATQPATPGYTADQMFPPRTSGGSRTGAGEATLPYTPEQLGRPLPPGRDLVQGEGGKEAKRARVDLEQGVRFLDPDGDFRIEFHDLTQVEYRAFSTPHPLVDTFDIPRQRLYFAGQVAKNYEFYSVINRGYGTLDVLDAYMNFKFDKAFNIRVGRTKTPYSYEYYKIAEGDLIAPERSVFVGNLSPNRQIGVMAYGTLFQDKLEYAAGVFNGPQRSFQDFNLAKDPFLFLDFRPFRGEGNPNFENLHFVASGTWGLRNKPEPEPNAYRTANDETTTAAIESISPAFLKLLPGVSEGGQSSRWAGEVAWFRKSLFLLAQYNGGFIGYRRNQGPIGEVPLQGGAVALTYFITGEEPVTRKEVEPLRPFKWTDPKSNPGAIELYTRTAYIDIGGEVFDKGFSDPNLWSNQALVLDNGVNWYLNRYVRIFLDWQHAEFASPVGAIPGSRTSSQNLYWFRTQIYY